MFFFFFWPTSIEFKNYAFSAGAEAEAEALTCRPLLQLIILHNPSKKPERRFLSVFSFLPSAPWFMNEQSRLSTVFLSPKKSPYLPLFPSLEYMDGSPSMIHGSLVCFYWTNEYIQRNTFALVLLWCYIKLTPFRMLKNSIQFNSEFFKFVNKQKLY